MIDLDAIKASGRNSAEHSAQLLALHLWRERVRVQSELCSAYLRDRPAATSDEFADFVLEAEVMAHSAVKV